MTSIYIFLKKVSCFYFHILIQKLGQHYRITETAKVGLYFYNNFVPRIPAGLKLSQTMLIHSGQRVLSHCNIYKTLLKVPRIINSDTAEVRSQYLAGFVTSQFVPSVQYDAIVEFSIICIDKLLFGGSRNK